MISSGVILVQYNNGIAVCHLQVPCLRESGSVARGVQAEGVAAQPQKIQGGSAHREAGLDVPAGSLGAGQHTPPSPEEGVRDTEGPYTNTHE